MIQRLTEQYYVLIIFYFTNFFFSRLDQTVDLSNAFLSLLDNKTLDYFCSLKELTHVPGHLKYSHMQGLHPIL